MTDTEHLYTVMIQQISDRFNGKTYTWEMKSKCMGLMGKEAAKFLIEALEMPIEPEEYISTSMEIITTMFPLCQLLPGMLAMRYYCINIKKFKMLIQ